MSVVFLRGFGVVPGGCTWNVESMHARDHLFVRLREALVDDCGVVLSQCTCSDVVDLREG